MKQQTKFLAIVLCLLGGTATMFSQQSKHEFSVYGGGGLSTLNYKVTTGEHKAGLGGQFGLGYHYFFSPEWGVGTGAELAFFNAKYNTKNLNIYQMTADIDDVLFLFRSDVSGFEEKQRAILLQIPLMLQFQTGGNRQFYVAAGGKVGIPLQVKYNNTASYSNSGYYLHENALYDTQEFLGFGNFPNKKSAGDLDFKTVFFLSAEAGVKWKLSDGLSLYTGVYMDYGLNKQSIATQSSIVEYNKANPSDFKVNSILTYAPRADSYCWHSRSTSSPLPAPDKIRPVAVGIKLRLAFKSIKN